MRKVGKGAIGVVAGVLVLGMPAAAQAGQKHCALPGSGPVRTATPSQVDLDSAKLAKAVRFAAARNRLSVRVYRNNCLVATSGRDRLTQAVPNQLWSSTKSVVSLLAGIAVTDGKLDVDAPIDRYLPTGTGWGDAAHRAITVRDLLTETAGLKQSILSEAATVGNDPNVAKQALALPLLHKPGTYFEYTQRVPDLLAFVVQRAVGQDLQRYAQKRLFGPIGIAKDDYFWLRDRSGNTYGYANLFLPSQQFGRIGLLLENGGTWRGRRLIGRGYMKGLRAPSAQNPCYGYLVWLNKGPCVTPSIFARRTLKGQILASAPDDLFATVGAFQQNNFVIPSLGVVVTWTGEGGDISTDPQTVVSANPHSELYWEFFRRFSRAVQDKRLHDPGPYVDDPANQIKPFEFIDPAVLFNGIGLGPTAPQGCNVLACDGDDLSAGPRQVLPDVIAAVLKAGEETARNLTAGR